MQTAHSSPRPDAPEPTSDVATTRREFTWGALTGAAALLFLGELSGCSKKESAGHAASMADLVSAIRGELNQLYSTQDSKGGQTLAVATSHMKEVCVHLASRLGAERFPQQPTDYGNADARAQLSKAMFAQGYVFRIGTLGADGAAFVSAQLYRVDPVATPQEFPKVQLGARAFSGPAGLSVHELREVLVEPYDYRKRQVASDKIEETLLVGTYIRELNTILYDPAAADRYARVMQRAIPEIKRDVLLNEYGHACLSAFVHGIEDPEGLQIDIKGETFSFHQVDEAFSDFVSLKYSETELLPLISRVLQEKPGGDYAFSAGIVGVSLSTLLSPYGDQAAIIPADVIPPNAPRLVAVNAISKYLAANPTAAQSARQRLIEIYSIILEKALVAFDSERRR